MARDLSLRLTCDPQAAASARRALLPLSGEIPDSVLEDVRLLLSELVTNSVRHGGGDVDSVDVSVRVSLAWVRVEVTDRGRGFEPGRERDTESTSGWGLVLVERLADRWGVDSTGGTRVWFELDTREASHSAGRSLAPGRAPGKRARGACHYVVGIPRTV